MSDTRYLPSRAALALVIAGTVALAAAAPALAGGKQGEIHACVLKDRRDGDIEKIRLVAPHEPCKRGWKRIALKTPKGTTGSQSGDLDRGRMQALEQDVQALKSQVQALQGLLAIANHIRVEKGVVHDLPGPHLIFEGVNVHVRSGAGSTAGTPAPNGLGNLVIGYNEPMPGAESGYRQGSHNLVVGPEHAYMATGGIVAGRSNTVAGDFATVTGGEWNLATGFASSVGGGLSNTASGDYAHVSGGEINEAEGFGSTVVGGSSNRTVGGDSTVSGGWGNTAAGDFSAVGGGFKRTAPGPEDWAAGSLLEDR